MSRLKSNGSDSNYFLCGSSGSGNDYFFGGSSGSGRDYFLKSRGPNQNSVLPVSISVTKYRVTFSKNDKFGQKITKNANNVKFVTKKRQLQ